jgi:hypothetical protein
LRNKRGFLGALILCVLTVFSVLGCSSSQGGFVVTQPNGPTVPVNGRVQSGGTAAVEGLAGATVRLFVLDGSGTPQLVAETTSNADGTFSANIAAFADRVLVASASLGNGVELFCVVGEQIPANIVINELTTVAGAYAGAQLYQNGVIQGGLLPVKIAAGWAANLANPATGESSDLLLGSPNADQTNCLRSTRNLANLLAACVQDPANCETLFTLTTLPGQAAPTNTIEALVNLARHPATNVAGILAQSRILEPYQPTLELQPEAWTLAVKVNQTGSAALPFGGSANTVFDDRGYAWINNNVIQGQAISTRNVVVLKPDGSPSDGMNGTPLSPVTGGGILGAGFGITRNPLDGHIWIGNFGWGGLNPDPVNNGPDANGSVSEIAPDGTPVSSDQGYFGGTERVQGIVVDPDGNVWMANTGSDKIVVFIGGDPNNSVEADLACHPFGLAVAADGTVWASTAGTLLPDVNDPCPPNNQDSVSHWRLNNGSLEMLSQTFVTGGIKGIDIDLEGFVWTASQQENIVQRFAPDGTPAGDFTGGGIEGPWDVRVDDNGDIWVANFGFQDLLPPNNIFRSSRITLLAGPNSPSGQPVGTPLTPPSGYTLPSAGEPVLLSDGTRLDQTGPGQPTFTPMMRLVSIVPDRAGNIWVTNNWKPNFTNNVIANPGGDGLVIFVGLAAPTEPGRTQ